MDIDRVIDEIAERHLGLVPRAAARAQGIDRDVLRSQQRRGLLVPLTPRLLRHAAVPVTEAQLAFAATIDVVGGAALSFDAAAWWWGIPGFPRRDLEVTALRSRHATTPLALVHRPTRHLADHITVLRGVAVTDLPWTIFNLASRHNPKRIARIIDSVGAKSPSLLVALHRLLPKMVGKGMSGCVAMRELLADRPPGIRLPGSGTQRHFEELMARAGITGLRREVDLGGHEWIGRVDYRCDVSGVIFEIDSELHHSSPSDVAADARRDAELIASGAPAVVRIPTEAVWSNPVEVVRTVRSARSRYASAGSTGRSRTEKEVS